jgi:hypothetical protein
MPELYKIEAKRTQERSEAKRTKLVSSPPKEVRSECQAFQLDYTNYSSITSKELLLYAYPTRPYLCTSSRNGPFRDNIIS